MDQDTPFADMSLWDKLATLTKGGLLRFKHYSAGNEHGKYPEPALTQFKRAMGHGRVNGNDVDRALNYGGGYDFGSRDVPMQDAADMARAYQLFDYMTTFDPKREEDAQRDYEENLAGVIAANADKQRGINLTPAQRMRKTVEWSRQNPRNYARGGLVEGAKGVYGDPRADYERAKAAVSGFTGLGERPSVMTGDPETYDKSELLSLLSNLIPGKGALAGLGALGTIKKAHPEVFYRGIPRLARDDMETITGLQQRSRSRKGVPNTKANVLDYAWASDNPKVAASYSHTGGATVPLRLTEEPGVILDARGNDWDHYFFPLSMKMQPIRSVYSSRITDPQNWYRLSQEAREAYNAGKYGKAIEEAKIFSPGDKFFERQVSGYNFNRLKPGEFKDAFEDPSIKSILVNNIVDPGMDTYLYLDGQNYSKAMRGNNLLIKDPSIMEYLLTGEKANFARGGLVQYHECNCRK